MHTFLSCNHDFPFVTYLIKWWMGFCKRGYCAVSSNWIIKPENFENFGCRTVEDFDDWTKWLFYKGGVGVKTEYSWEAWWMEEQVRWLLDRNMVFWSMIYWLLETLGLMLVIMMIHVAGYVYDRSTSVHWEGDFGRSCYPYASSCSSMVLSIPCLWRGAAAVFWWAFNI